MCYLYFESYTWVLCLSCKQVLLGVEITIWRVSVKNKAYCTHYYQTMQKYIGITLIVDLGRFTCFTLNNNPCSLLIMCVPTPPWICMRSWLDLDKLVNYKVNMRWTFVTLMEANLPFIKMYEYSLLTISYHCLRLAFAFVIQTKTWNLTTITSVL